MQEIDNIQLGPEKICVWEQPNPKARFRVVVSHGFAEYALAYQETAERLAEAGARVWLYDLPGHGMSTGIRGHAAGFQELTGALRKVLNARLQESSELPLFLLGHSLGGLITAGVLADYHKRLAGVVLLSPLCGFDPAKQLTFSVLYRVLNDWLKKPNRPFPKMLDPALLTRDPKKLAEYFRQPMRLHLGTPSMVRSMWEGMEELKKNRRECSCPLLIFQSQADRVVSPQATGDFFNSMDCKNKKIVWYSNGQHELLNESNRMETFAILRSFFEQNSR